MFDTPIIYHRIIFDKALEFGAIDKDTHERAVAGEIVKIKLQEGMEIDCVMSQFIPYTPTTNKK